MDGNLVRSDCFVVNKEFAARHSLLNYNWNNIMTSPQIRLSMTDFIAADMAEDLLLSMAEHFGITEALYLLSEELPYCTIWEISFDAIKDGRYGKM